MIPYLYANQNPNAPQRANGKRFWGYPSRPGGTRPRVIGVHTAESAFDQIGADTGAEGVARYQSTTDRPSSYHRIVDRDSTMLQLPDEAVAFGIGNFNSATLHLSFALRAVDWSDPAKARAAEPMLRRAADVAREWCRAYGIPLRWLTKAEADAGRSGFLRHGTYDPTRRSDPGKDFPADRFFALIGSTTPTTEDDDMTPEQDQRQRDADTMLRALYNEVLQVRAHNSAPEHKATMGQAVVGAWSHSGELIGRVAGLEAALQALSEQLPNVDAEAIRREVRAAVEAAMKDVSITLAAQTPPSL